MLWLSRMIKEFIIHNRMAQSAEPPRDSYTAWTQTLLMTLCYLESVT